MHQPEVIKAKKEIRYDNPKTVFDFGMCTILINYNNNKHFIVNCIFNTISIHSDKRHKITTY